MRRLALLLSLALLAGCNDEVDPTIGLEVPFSLYGYLDPTTDQQAIRVVPIVGDLEAVDDPVVATVTSTDLEDGQTTVWRDSVVTFSDGSSGIIHIADYTPRPGARVRIEVATASGSSSTAEVEVPSLVSASVGPPQIVPGEATYTVQFVGAPRVLNGQLRLSVLRGPAGDESTSTIIVPLSIQPREVEPDIWTINIPFVSSTRRALEGQGLVGADIRLLAVDYVGFVANEAWDVPTADPDALAEPGVFSNVEDGLGFIGSGYFTAARWVPESPIQVAAGFATDDNIGSLVTVNEISVGDDWVELYNGSSIDIDLRGYSLSDDDRQPRRFALPPGTIVPAGGFLVLDLPFDLRLVDVNPSPGIDDFQVSVGLYDRTSTRLSRVIGREIFDKVEEITFGSFPDGGSFLLPTGEDLFQGPVRETRGQPNEFGINVAVVNEVFTEGSAGWVEALILGHDASDLRLMTEPNQLLSSIGAAGSPFAVADEAPGAFDLFQLGGKLYLVATYLEPRLAVVGQAIRTRVVDVRRFGGQTPGRSVGYLPDGPSGGWTTGLRPSRGAPNTLARRPR